MPEAPDEPDPAPANRSAPPRRESVADDLERWLGSDPDERTLGSLVERVDEKAFALLFLLLLTPTALPLPTGGATHVFEVVTVLLALQLIGGRKEIWLPRRWRGVTLGGERTQRLLWRLARLIRRLERLARPRMTWLFGHRASGVAFGALVVVLAVVAFLAPPFSGLDTLPALGVVILSLGVLFEDALVALAGILVGIAGTVLIVVLAGAAARGISGLL
jgi:hypothetical protein